MAVPAKSDTEEKSPYSVNKDLFGASAKIKEKMELIEKRLQKMEEHRSEVSDSVFLKVKTDYETQLDEVRDSFREKCSEIEGELEQLYQAQKKQQSSLAEHEEVLEEAKFRRTLGEFTEKRYKEIETKENKDIKHYQGVLDVIKESIQQYENILGGPFTPGAVPEEEELSASQFVEEGDAEFTPAMQGSSPSKKAKAKKAKPKKTEAKEAKPPSLGDDLDSFLETEGDYFSSKEESEIAVEEEDTGALEVPETVAPSAFEPPPVSTTQPDDDSISNILRDIPLEETTGEPEEKAKSELTGTQNVAAETKVNLSVPTQEASLLLLEGELEESEYILSENTSIGRSPSNDVVLKESKISRQHANINFRDGNYVIMDLKSSNGVLINGKKVEEANLNDGDEISIGSFKFQFNIL